MPIDVSTELSCDIAARIINDWMKLCLDHSECNSHSFLSENELKNDKGEEKRESGIKKDINVGYPKRLIWLDEDVKTARLVASPTEKKAPYAALSYCWGREIPGIDVFKTDKETLPIFEEGIPLKNLPQTLNDVFVLTKKLGFDYVWVDALCIVQHNQQEWEQESRKMGSIYSNAKIVLSATQAAHVNDGMFMQRSTTTLCMDVEAVGGTMKARRNLNHEIIISCRTKSDKWWETHINTIFPVLSRGWCFQERLLATRIVHFTATELVFECQTTRKCECRIVQSHLYPAKNNIASALRICLDESMDKRGIRQMWREIVRSYSVRKLTNIDDKLPALSGIAALLKNKSGYVYAAGLWKESMPFDLLWRSDQTGDLKSTKERSPSWSWISVDGAIKWPISQQQNEEQPLQYISSTTYFEHGAMAVEVSNVDCQLSGQNDYGGVVSGRLTLRTRLVKPVIHFVTDKSWNALYETNWGVRVGDSDPSPIWPDLNENGLLYDPVSNIVREKFHLMEVMKPGKNSEAWEEALLVRSKPGLKNEYGRVGVAANVSPKCSRYWKTEKSWFDSAQLVEIILV